MSRKARTFRQGDLVRALRAAKLAGFRACRVTIKQDAVVIDEKITNANDAEHFPENPWDEVLSNAEDAKRSA